MLGFPNNHGGFPTKNDEHLGCEMGGNYQHLRKHPNILQDKWHLGRDSLEPWLFGLIGTIRTTQE